MSSFNPTRASPSATTKPLIKFDLANLTAISNTSSTASTALSGLSEEEVSLIDEIIDRAPSTATTFLTVFKAYNEVLQEKGMDPSTDIVYYRMLLKLGVIKGKDWGEKWKTVKQQFGYDSFASTGTPATQRTTHKTSRPIAAPKADHKPSTLRFARTERDSSGIDADSITVHSHQESVDVENTNIQTPHHLLDSNSTGNALRLTLKPSVKPAQNVARPKATMKNRHIEPTISSMSSEQLTLLSSTPPSYNAATADTPSSIPPVSHAPMAAQRGSHKVEKSSKRSVLNEEEAWLRVKIAQDEKEADQFRKERLLERCWQVWRDGLEWIVASKI